MCRMDGMCVLLDMREGEKQRDGEIYTVVRERSVYVRTCINRKNELHHKFEKR